MHDAAFTMQVQCGIQTIQVSALNGFLFIHNNRWDTVDSQDKT